MSDRPYAPDDYSDDELARELDEIVPVYFEENEWAARVVREAVTRLAALSPQSGEVLATGWAPTEALKKWICGYANKRVLKVERHAHPKWQMSGWTPVTIHRREEG